MHFKGVFSTSRNTLKVYDIARTLCGLGRTRHKADKQVVDQAMRIYGRSPLPPPHGLCTKASCEVKNSEYMEILL
jgi:hypothetical protein